MLKKFEWYKVTAAIGLCYDQTIDWNRIVNYCILKWIPIFSLLSMLEMIIISYLWSSWDSNSEQFSVIAVVGYRSLEFCFPVREIQIHFTSIHPWSRWLHNKWIQYFYSLWCLVLLGYRSIPFVFVNCKL